jgi:hypothetical protein
MIVYISMTVLKSDVPGFICDRYNGHVYLESASRIGNKQKQTPRHHCKNLLTRHRRGTESKDDRAARTRNRESLEARDNYGMLFD